MKINNVLFISRKPYFFHKIITSPDEAIAIKRRHHTRTWYVPVIDRKNGRRAFLLYTDRMLM